MTKNIYSVPSQGSNHRLDTFIAGNSYLTRSFIQKLIRKGLITVNSIREKPGYRLREGDRIEMEVPAQPEAILIPEEIPLDIIYEDEHIVVVNKPPDMVIYPALGNRSGTLMNALVFQCSKLSSIGAPLRPGVVHRLDKDTSGLLVVAKDDAAYYALVRQFRDRQIEKYYLALVFESIKKDRGEITASIGRSESDRKKMSTRTKKGKEAITRFEVIKRFGTATLVKVRIITGRTHQIRVHFASLGHPVLGDKTYGQKTRIKHGQKLIRVPRQMLHAVSLKLRQPVSGELMEFTAPVPGDMDALMRELG